MKKNIQKLLVLLFATVAILIVLTNAVFIIRDSMRQTEEASQRLFWQIESVMSQNNIELQKATAEIKEQCITKANAVAYFLSDMTEEEQTPEQLRKLAKYVDVDEIHLFTPDGVIYTGSNEEYIGFSFNSGEQMRYFFPMLEDTSLSMCQEIAPNTAENKPMQYAATWSADKSIIVQIGYDPRRVIEITQNNELPYIFSLLTDSSDSTLLAIDPDTFEIVGSADEEYVGKSCEELGISSSLLDKSGKGRYINFSGSPLSYACFSKIQDVYVCRVVSFENMTAGMLSSCIMLLIYIILIFALTFILLSHYLDKKIISSISKINSMLMLITEGAYDLSVEVHSTQEFTQLSGYINKMVKRLKDDMELDALTEVFNNRALYSKIAELFKSGETGTYAAVFIIDADGLKKVNDTYGHIIGDSYIKAVAKLLSQISAPNKDVFRIGGDEFCVIIYNENSSEVFDGYLSEYKTLRDAAYMPPDNGLNIPIKFSVGMAVYPIESEDYQGLMHIADERMYADKLERNEERK